jgi:membrane-associated phospholipid phosphatase
MEKKSLLTCFKATELISFAYILLTAIYIIVFFSKIDNALELLLFRVLFGGVIILLAFLGNKMVANGVIRFVRYAFPLSLIVYWYPETYFMNECIFSNLDHIFVSIDQWLFGCQPSLEFSHVVPFRWFSELMNFGYCSYFLIIISIALYFYFKENIVKAYRVIFLILCSFFVYYILFIILPVVGPQFYFPETLVQVPDGYLFSSILEQLQSMGEKPTGAFPSSHVGISLICLIIVFKNARHLFWYYLPVVVILIFSTVYIKAHYVIDVIGGLVSAPLIYGLSVFVYQKIVASSSVDS